MIDLNSLRQALAQHPALKEAALLVREEQPGQRTLVAYVVQKANSAVGEGEVLQLLRAQLPSAEASIAVVFLDQLPKTSSGEVDYSNLPATNQPSSQPAEMIMPRSATEKILAQIWAEVIGIEEVGVHDNFFDLGGHSVLVTQVALRIRNVFNIDIGLRPIFERPTVAALAETIESLLVEEISSMSEEEADELAATSGILARNSQ
jgi:hypothetical protein